MVTSKCAPAQVGRSCAGNIHASSIASANAVLHGGILHYQTSATHIDASAIIGAVAIAGVGSAYQGIRQTEISALNVKSASSDGPCVGSKGHIGQVGIPTRAVHTTAINNGVT